MNAAEFGTKGSVARAIAEEYGVMQSTVSMGWTTWAREFGIEPKRTSLFIPKARTDEYATV
jgi:hypothetical protein